MKDWRIMQLPNGSGWPWSQVGHGDRRRKKSKTGEDGNTQLRLAPETEEERRAKKKGMDLI